MKETLILWLAVLWLPILMAGLLCNETKFKKNLVIGVTLPYPAREDEAVQRQLASFRKVQKGLAAGLILAGLLCMLVPDALWNSVLWGTWLLVSCVAPHVVYARWNGKLKALKEERGWAVLPSSEITVDTAHITPANWQSPLLFLLPLLVSLLPLLWERVFLPVYLMDAGLVLLFYLSYRFLYRNRSERVDEDQSLTAALTAIRRRNWGRMWQLSAWMMAGLSLVFAGMGNHPTAGLAAVLLLCFGMSAAIVWVELNTRSAQERLTAESGKGAYVDEDDLWLWGIFYYNPQDSHLLVNNRVGTNSSVNLARPMGKALMGVLVDPCQPVRFRETEGYLIRFYYYGHRISFEAFHALADGTGSLIFFRSLLAEYLRLLGHTIPTGPGLLDPQEPPRYETELEDAYLRYAGKAARGQPLMKRAYSNRGEPEPFYTFHVTMGFLSVAQLKERTKALGVSITEYLSAALIHVLLQKQAREVSERHRRPVALAIPIDLRAFFPTESLRNFILTTQLAVDPPRSCSPS